MRIVSGVYRKRGNHEETKTTNTFILLNIFSTYNYSQKRLLNGVLTTAEIIEISETGTYINEQPLVRLTVRFEDNGQIIDMEVKMLVSVLDPPHRGEQVLVSYDRRKKKASLITKQEAEELHRKKTDALPDDSINTTRSFAIKRISPLIFL